MVEEKTAEYRLPTEAEWEYACRAGTTTQYSLGDDTARFGEYAWYRDNSDKRTHPVGEKKPNAWRLHDMHGNVWERCQDRYAEEYYAGSPPSDPPGATEGTLRVLRGGTWECFPRYCRSALRYGGSASYRLNNLGFRVVRGPSGK